jgi:hypothetical protein
MKGYSSFKDRIKLISDNKTYLLKSVELRVAYGELEPVTISRVRPIIIGEDTITFQATAYQVREGAEVEALLNRLPGIRVDQNGDVIFQGRKIIKVMVDGKLFFGGDVLTAIRNLPTEIVDKIQLIDDYGDKAHLTGIKTGRPDKLMNIVLKQDKKNGEFGQIAAGGGNKGKFNAGFFSNLFSGEQQFSLNGRVEDNNPAGSDLQKSGGINYANRLGKWKVENSATISSGAPHSANQVGQDSYYAGGQIHQEQSFQYSGSNNGISEASAITYAPDAFHTLRVSPSISWQQLSQTIQSRILTTEYFDSSVKTSNGESYIVAGTKTLSATLGLYMELLSHYSRRRFTVQLNASNTNNDQSNNNVLNTEISSNNLMSSLRQHYLISNMAISRNFDAAIQYYSPAGENGFIEIGYSLRSNLSSSIKVTRETDSLQRSMPIDSLTGDYKYLVADQRLHVGYTGRIKQLTLTAGLDAQPGYMQGTENKRKNTTYHYLAWRPSFQASYPISKLKILSFEYSGNNALPDLQKVQPVTDIANPQYPIKGNPGLRSAYSHSINMHYDQSSIQATQYSGFGVNVGLILTENTILQSIVHPKDTSNIIQTITYVNAGSTFSSQAGYYINLPSIVKKRLRIMLNGQITGNTDLSLTDNVLYTIRSINTSQSLNINYLVPDRIESEASLSYSINANRYSSGNVAETNFSAASLSLRNRHYFFRHWVLVYQYSQSFTNTGNKVWKSNPAFLTTTLKREFFAKNKASISASAFDLLNTGNGVRQSFSSTSSTTTQAALIGRYFLLQFTYKWGKFK